MGKRFSFQSAIILFWVFFFITAKFCSAYYSASSATQAFQENEAKPENANLGSTGSVNPTEEDKFKSVKKPFNKKPLQSKPVILKKPFIEVPPRIPDIQRLSPKPPIFEEKPVQMVRRPNFLLIPFLKHLFPIMKKPEHALILQFKRPALKPIPCVKNSKFLPFPIFKRPIPKRIPIVKKPIPEFEKPISEPIPEFEKPISEPIPAADKPIPELEKPISEPIPATEKSIPELVKPISEPIPAAEKPIPENEKHTSKPIPSIKEDLLLPQLAPTIAPESLKLKESLFKKPIPKIPFPPKFKKPLPAHKPISPP